MKIHLHIPTAYDTYKFVQALDRLMLQHPDQLANHEYICHHTTSGPQVTAKLGGRASDGEVEKVLNVLHQELFGAPAAPAAPTEPAAPTTQPAAQTYAKELLRTLAASFLRSMAVHVGLVTEDSANYARQLATDLTEIGEVGAAYCVTHIANNCGGTLNGVLQQTCKQVAERLDARVPERVVGRITPAPRGKDEQHRQRAANFLSTMAVQVSEVTSQEGDYAKELLHALVSVGETGAANCLGKIAAAVGGTMHEDFRAACRNHAAGLLRRITPGAEQITPAAEPAPETQRLPLRIEIANFLDGLSTGRATQAGDAALIAELAKQADSVFHHVAQFLRTLPTFLAAGSLPAGIRAACAGVAGQLRTEQAACEPKPLKVDGWELERRRRDAAVIAGLRLLQHHLTSVGTPGLIMGVILTDNGAFDPLSVQEIDDLIKSTNE